MDQIKDKYEHVVNIDDISDEFEKRANELYVTLLIKHEKISQEKIKVAIKEEYERELKDNRLKIIEDALHT